MDLSHSAHVNWTKCGTQLKRRWSLNNVQDFCILKSVRLVGSSGVTSYYRDDRCRGFSGMSVRGKVTFPLLLSVKPFQKVSCYFSWACLSHYSNWTLMDLAFSDLWIFPRRCWIGDGLWKRLMRSPRIIGVRNEGIHGVSRTAAWKRKFSEWR